MFIKKKKNEEKIDRGKKERKQKKMLRPKEKKKGAKSATVDLLSE